MKIDPPPSAEKRAYRLGARAASAQASIERMQSAFIARLGESWFEDIRLDDIAADAGVSVQTVIRRFGSKEGLLEAAVAQIELEVDARRDVQAGDAAGAVSALLEDYEASGDMMIRVLAQEDRHAVLRRATDKGRAGHRAWLHARFAERLDPLDASERERRLDSLVAATDVYLWKLMRRDLGRSPGDWQAMAERFLTAALDGC